jgi:hypothetical protein
MENLYLGLKFMFCVGAAFPIGTLEHELGHLLAAKLMKSKARLTYGSVEEEGTLSSRQWFFHALGGVLATWILCLVAFLVLVSTGSFGEESMSLGRVALSCIALFVVHNLFAEYYYFRSGGQTGAGDERIIARYLEIPLMPFMVVELVLTLTIVIGTFWLVQSGERLGAILGFLVGIILGYVGWYGWLGPVVSPAQLAQIEISYSRLL